MEQFKFNVQNFQNESRANLNISCSDLKFANNVVSIHNYFMKRTNTNNFNNDYEFLTNMLDPTNVSLFKNFLEIKGNLKQYLSDEQMDFIGILSNSSSNDMFKVGDFYFMNIKSSVLVFTQNLQSNKPVSNIPTNDQVIEVYKKWRKYGQYLFCIPSLYNEDKCLHDEYMSLFRGSYFLYNGIKPELSSKEYRLKKNNVFLDVIKWARKHYYNGNPKISDVLYDTLVQARFVKTTINPSSSRNGNGDVVYKHHDVDFSCFTHSELSWLEYGKNFYTSDLAKTNDEKKLNLDLIELKRISYFYYNNIKLSNAFKGKDGFKLYTGMKIKTYSKIIEILENKRKNNVASITDVARDYILQAINIANFENPNSVNTNN